MSTVADYRDRLNDVAILHEQALSGRKSVKIGLSPGQICTGVQKLVQTVYILLFTEAGTDPFDASRGTTFMTSVRAGRVTTEEAARTEFSRAAEDVVQWLRDRELSTTPDDERLRTLVLESVGLEDDFLSLSVRLSFASGRSFTIILPIGIPIGQ